MGQLLDFLLGQSGQRRLKDRLVDFYVAIDDDQHWLRAIQTPATVILLYCDTIFAASRVNAKSITRIIAYSITLTFIIYCLLLMSNVHSHGSLFILPFKGAESIYTPKFVLLTLGLNVVFDFIAIFLVRYGAAIISRSTATRALVILLLAVIGSVGLFATAIAFQNGLGAFIFGYEIFPSIGDDMAAFWLAFKNSYLFLILHPSVADLTPMLPSLQILVPAGTFLLSLGISLLIYASRGLTKNPLLLIVERLEEAKAGIFTTVASVASAIIAIMTALSKWLMTSS